ncbi:MAG: FAD-dependent oxidoreductase [Reyranella sp.]|uniref:GcvT family protein n=1 Tax=Reyranella sp. TaxID=1929291 RepID=UPI0025FD80CC|nr:FAD-dependent oxidoreductase [Reyranella sp.]MBR2819376.1 FAD-dependent oxidoreductase [Reyranella sp.]
MAATFPTQARVVIVGGGIMGCSTAYHLAKLGWKDVVLLEQGRLSGGTTWHAAGLVGQLRSYQNLTRLIRYSTELYSKLEAETGLATGWKQCGSLSVARTEERMVLLRRSAAMANAQGVDCEPLTPQQAGEKYPIMRTDDLVGAVWLPGDGKANPADITQALAKGARNGGVRIFEKVRVTGIDTKDGRVTGVQTTDGAIKAEIVVNCAGQWARQLGRKVGVTVPLYSCEHMYIVTEKMEGVPRDLPVMRDPDGYIYFKEEVGGLLMGGFEPEAKPWNKDVIPDDFEFGMLPDDWDQFQILMDNALIRVPSLEKTGIKTFMNGPESFTPDLNYILGEAPQLRGFFVGAGFNSMGIASSGGAGMALAEWIVAGEPTMDLWPVDIRRFAGFHGNDAWLRARVSETLGLHYKMSWPQREQESGRPFRRSPLYDRLKARGAWFGNKMGWERPNWFAGLGKTPEMTYGWGRGAWFDAVAAEHRATREGVTVADETSFGKILVQGRDAEKALQQLCANDVALPVGRTAYTGVLNARGTFESDFTVARLARDKFLIVTGSAQPTRDMDWLGRNLPSDAHAVLTDVTSAWTVLSVMGPRSRALLQKVSSADFSNDGFPFAAIQEISVGYATVLAARRTYMGELGWELYVPVEFAATVFETLHAAGEEFGLRDAGYYAIEGLRLEKGYRAWGRELTPDDTPFQAGLGWAVKLDKPGGFIGQKALLEAKAKPLARRLVSIVLEDGEPLLWGGEALLRDGKAVGDLTSAAYGHTIGAAVGLGYVKRVDGEAIDAAWLAGRFEVDLAGNRLAAKVSLRAPYDPQGARIKV